MQLEQMNDQAGIGQTSELAESIDRAAEMIVDSDYAVAMTGAGMSVESGIPPFRGAGGLWTRYGTPPMDGYSRFKADPQGYWHREMNREIDAHILELRNALAAAKPHEGHRALARMVRDGALKTVITQNIDGLDERAGITDLIEIHGNRSRLRCTTCGARKRLGGFVLDGPPAPCGACGGPVKYDTVMFGEPVPEDTMSAARRQTGMADCMVAIGTSATVRPASGLLWIAKVNGARIVEINPERNEADLNRRPRGPRQGEHSRTHARPSRLPAHGFATSRSGAGFTSGGGAVRMTTAHSQ